MAAARATRFAAAAALLVLSASSSVFVKGQEAIYAEDQLTEQLGVEQAGAAQIQLALGSQNHTSSPPPFDADSDSYIPFDPEISDSEPLGSPPWTNNKYFTASGEFFSPVAMNAVFSDDLLDEYRTNPYVCQHKYDVEVVRRDPMIIYIRGFLQPGESEHMITLGAPRMNRSGLLDNDTGKTSTGLSRTSSSAFLDAAQNRVVECIEERAANFANVDKSWLEPLQVVWYKVGQEYKPHYDYFDPIHPNLKTYVEQHGQREYTFFVYLNDRSFDDDGNPHPLEGGATEFPNLNLKVPPKKGDAVFWTNKDINGVVDPRLLHAGTPVERGEKFGTNIWIRDRPWA